MPRPPKPLDERALRQLDGFAQQVGRALEHANDAAWLGGTSPLAAPYLLGSLPDLHADDSLARGRTLQALILQAVDALPDAALRDFAVAAYLQRDPYLTNAGLALRLNMAERHFYRLRSDTIRAVAEQLYGHLLTPLQLETPLQAAMVGRSDEHARASHALQAGRTVYLTGSSGLGKTTLAAQVASAWGAFAFWYTVRLGYNDRFDRLLFSLAYFLRRHGGHRTWRQLVANSGAVDSAQVLGLLRYDLGAIAAEGTAGAGAAAGGAARPLLLCVDDVDLLTPERSDHAQMLHLLDELRPYAALLLTGQRVVLDSDDLILLKPLTDGELADWSHALSDGLALSPGELRRLTRGVPLVLTALRLLARSDPEALASVRAAGRPLDVESLFVRVWRKLSAAERTFLGQLAIFETTAPADIWLDEASGASDMQQAGAFLTRLTERALILPGHAGEVQIAPYLRPHVLEHLAADQRELLHQWAAHALEERGRFTDAVHHWIEGGKPELAIWLWFRHRRAEIDRGQAGRALDLLAAIPTSRLHAENDRTALRMALAELYLHVGRAEDAALLLQGQGTLGTRAVRAHVQELRADAAERLGQSEQALAYYRGALDTLLGAPDAHEVRMRTKLVYLFTARLPDLEGARQEALRARCRAELYHGTVEEMLGHLDEALQRYEAARALAERAPVDAALLANVYSQLGKLQIVRGAIDEAAALVAHAIRLSEERGDLLQPLYDRINLAYGFGRAHSHERAYATALDGLAHARRMGHAYLIGGLASAAAEACVELKRIDEAEALALEAAQQEEEWFQHWALAVLARVRSAQGRHSQALTLADQALASAQSVGNPYSEAYCLRVRGDLRRAAGEPAAARADYTRAAALYQQMGLVRECQELSPLLEG